jgi:hypothetical protein
MIMSTSMPRPVLLKRLPKLRWRPAEDWPFMSQANREAFPELAEEFAVLDAELMETFRAFDHDALEAQNRFRLLQLLLLVGGAVATVLGTVQAALDGGALALGITEAVLAGLLAPLAVAARSGKSHHRYLTSRLKAERLRSEYFVYLAGAGGYAALERGERRRLLGLTVAAIADSEAGS